MKHLWFNLLKRAMKQHLLPQSFLIFFWFLTLSTLNWAISATKLPEKYQRLEIEWKNKSAEQLQGIEQELKQWSKSEAWTRYLYFSPTQSRQWIQTALKKDTSLTLDSVDLFPAYSIIEGHLSRPFLKWVQNHSDKQHHELKPIQSQIKAFALGPIGYKFTFFHLFQGLNLILVSGVCFYFWNKWSSLLVNFRLFFQLSSLLKIPRLNFYSQLITLIFVPTLSAFFIGFAIWRGLMFLNLHFAWITPLKEAHWIYPNILTLSSLELKSFWQRLLQLLFDWTSVTEPWAQTLGALILLFWVFFIVKIKSIRPLHE